MMVGVGGAAADEGTTEVAGTVAGGAKLEGTVGIGGTDADADGMTEVGVEGTDGWSLGGLDCPTSCFFSEARMWKKGSFLSESESSSAWLVLTTCTM
jgi:hypothetical protein